MSLRHHMPTLLAGLMVLASGWLLTRLTPDEAPLPTGADGPDFYLGRFSMLSMDGQGQPRHRIEGEALQHLPARAESRLQQPRFLWRLDEGSQWRASAERGVLTDDLARLRLQGVVNIEGQGRNGPLTLKTRDLDVRPGQGSAETGQAITLTTPRARVTAVGLRLTLEQQRLQLLQDVRGRYEP